MHAAGVVAYPTEAVWGLGCDPWSEPAVAKILRLKRRSVGKGVILIAHSMEQFAPFLSGLDQSAHDRLKASWPGPATWLVPNNGVAPDWISGGRNYDTLYGDDGNDLIEGGEAADLIYGGTGNDVLKGDAGNDTLYGEAGDDTLRGHGDNDILYGGTGNDTLEGYDGNDSLIGQEGSDILYGNAGWDRFFFDITSANGDVDTIKDFSTADYEKIVVLEDILVGYDAQTSAIEDFVTFTSNGGNTDIFVDRDGAEIGYSAIQIATLENVTGLSYGNNIRIETEI